MFSVNKQSHLKRANEMEKRIDEIFAELRLEYRDMEEWYDEALRRIEELEADIIYVEETRNGQV
ncbi:MAG: hypothetical protein Q4C02_09245 [Eubacteriales bacterium]|nr:hypothetical protein [Eubacteriales bacterium]